VYADQNGRDIADKVFSTSERGGTIPGDLLDSGVMPWSFPSSSLLGSTAPSNGALMVLQSGTLQKHLRLLPIVI
jgi:hypothetical protein